VTKLNGFMDRLWAIALGAGLDSLLSEVDSSDQRLKAVTAELVSDSDLGALLTAEVASIRKKLAASSGESSGSKGAKPEAPDRTPIEENVRLFGIQNAANFVIVHKLARQLPTAKALARDPRTGRMLQGPVQILAHAFQAREAFGEDGRYRDSAFAAGLVFDILQLLIAVESAPTSQRKLSEFVLARFQRGVHVGVTAVRLARAKNDLKLERHLAAAALLREAGKGVMALMFNDYVAFAELHEKNATPAAIRILVERDRFGGGHPAISRALALTFEVIDGSGASREDRNELATLLREASASANAGAGAKGGKP
jgi:hypothetical protein